LCEGVARLTLVETHPRGEREAGDRIEPERAHRVAVVVGNGGRGDQPDARVRGGEVAREHALGAVVDTLLEVAIGRVEVGYAARSRVESTAGFGGQVRELDRSGVAVQRAHRRHEGAERLRVHRLVRVARDEPVDAQRAVPGNAGVAAVARAGARDLVVERLHQRGAGGVGRRDRRGIGDGRRRGAAR
jgi:hypothetical protein